MDDTLLQIILVLVCLGILAVALPARNRLRKRNWANLPELIAAPEPEKGSAPAGAKVPSEVNPLEKFLADHLRRGHHPTVHEIMRVQRELERKNWPVPEVQEIIDEFTQRRDAIAQSKLQRSLAMQGHGAADSEPVITHNGQPVGVAPISTRPAQSGSKLSEMRAATLDALVRIPAQLPDMPYSDFDQLMIPLLFDGGEWHGLKLVAGSHWGFFGVTRSGKGNALQHIALHALAFGPELVRLIVLDAKGGLDYTFCEKISHAALYADHDIMDGANTALDEMDRRKALLKAADCRNHYEYERKTGEKLPLVIIIADEIAEFNEEQHARIATLARTSGAMGGILMVATQYPVAKVLPTQIQANVGNRLVFRLASSDQIKVAMRRSSEDDGTYNPALITEKMKGVGVLRLPGGDEILGRVPEVSDQVRDRMIEDLVAQWPKIGERSPVPAHSFPTRQTIIELKQASLEGSAPGEQPGIGAGTTDEEEGSAGGTPEIDDETIASMLRGGLPARKIMKLLKGRNEKRLERINRIEQSLKQEVRQDEPAQTE